MKLLLLGDTHFSGKSPERRKDDYFNTQLKKLDQVITNIAWSNDCKAIIQVGDFFNSPYTSDYVKARLIDILLSCSQENDIPIFCIFGQHDIFGHTSFTYQRSPLAVLEAAECVELLGDSPTVLDSLAIYGASFGEAVPKVLNTNSFNILVVHDMIGDRELYPGQELKGPRKYLREHPEYGLIVCGDYHYTFRDTWDGRVICNPGCMMRKTINPFDLDHKPGVFVFDTKTKDLEWFPLTIGSVEDVFDLTVMEKSTTDSSQTMAFIESLRQNQELKNTWPAKLQELYETMGISEDIQNLLSRLIQEALGDN